MIAHLRLGAGRALVDLAVQQARGRRHDVLVAIADDAEEMWKSDAALLRELDAVGIRSTSIGDLFHRELAGLAASVERLRTLVAPWDGSTIVHVHTAMAAAVARWAGAPCVIATCHGWNLSRPVEHDLQDALAFALADVIVSPSTYWADRVAALPGRHDVRVVPYGFDFSRYPARPPAPPAPDRLRIVCVGELTRRKGQDLLVEAMSRVWGDWPDAQLHLLGDGDLGAPLRERVQQLDPERHRVTFHGHVARPYFELAGYDVFCLPSRSDNQPVAIVEAMLAGLPIVSTDVGGIPEMIAGARSGEIVPADSIDALADAILRVSRRADRREVGGRGRAFACREYDVEVAVERIDAVYREALTS